MNQITLTTMMPVLHCASATVAAVRVLLTILSTIIISLLSKI